MSGITTSRTLIAATVAASAILGIIASASSSGSSKHTGKVHVLKVHSNGTNDTVIDVPRSRASSAAGASV